MRKISCSNRGHLLAICIIVLALQTARGEALKTSAQKIISSLPRKAGGWLAGKEVKSYDRKTLYDYIDGGAELYLSYDFRSAANRTYRQKGWSDIVVDIFDMGNTADAYGVFSLAREIEADDFGQGSQYESGLMQFFKNRFYISIMCFPETPESKKTIFSLARAIDAAIAEPGRLPEILSLLPEKSRKPASVKYFRNHAWLNSTYFIADKDILHIDSAQAAALAKYNNKASKKPYILVLAEFAGEKKAAQAQKSFFKHYLPESGKQQCGRIENGTWACCFRETNLLIAVFESPDKSTAEQAAKDVGSRLKKRSTK